MFEIKSEPSRHCFNRLKNRFTFLPLMMAFSFCSLLFADAKEQYDWPQFHGPRRDNISLEKDLLKTWPDQGPGLIWKVSGLGHGYSSVSMANGVIYTAGNINKESVIIAISVEGQELWRAKNGKAWTKSYPGTRGTPTIDGTMIYHQNPFGNIVCLKAETGKVVWAKDILTEVNSKNNIWGLAESLLIDGDRLISCPGDPETCMVALDKNTGSVIWKSPSTNELAGYASPILIDYQGLRIIVTLTAKAIIGVNADNGNLLWHVKHESYADENVMLPIYYDGCIFISTLAHGSVKWKLHVKDKKVELKEVWQTKELDNHHGGVLLLKGNLYGASMLRNKNKWVCLDWQTGKMNYAATGIGKGSLTCADGMLYTLGIDRLMGLVQPSSTEFKLVSSFKIPVGGKEKSWAHPVVCNGRLYIRHGEFLYAYAVSQNQ